MITRSIAALGALLMLGGCGLVEKIEDALDDSKDKAEAVAEAVAPDTVAELRNAVRSQLYGQAGQLRVSFGSVAVATGARVTGVDSSYTGQRATATIQRGSAGTLSLDSADVYYDSGVQTSAVDLPNRRSRTRYVFDHTGSSATLGLLAVDWSNGDPGDYLAGGYWLHVEANPFSLQVGAFVDGPELDMSNPPSLPVSGAASYQGSSAGLYALQYGTDGGAVPAGSEELGEFAGIATLTANFTAGTIGGCVGCVGDILLSGVYHDSASGDVSTFEDVPTAYRVNLGAVAFNRSNATFQGSNVTLTHPLAPDTQSSGAWAGQFSNRMNGSGDPRLVAGTFGGEGATPGGSRTVFVGAFAAGSR